MSYLSARRQGWRADARLAVLFASLAGAATTVGVAACLFAMAEYQGFASNSAYGWPYLIGMALNVAIEIVGLLVPASAVCALGLALCGVPAVHWLGERARRGWVALLGVGWGGVAGGVFGVVLFDWMFGGEAEWPVFFLLGAAFGAPTGFWWWFFHRRVFIRRALWGD